MKEQPLVSVLMTAYNREKFIAEAIESVLASTYTNFELIIVDDCSKDRTVEIAKSYETKDTRIRVYVNEKNLGDYPNRNRAASYAKGKYIKYVDSDDIIYPHGLEVMVRSMEQFPKAGFGLSSKVDDMNPFPVYLSPVEFYKESFGDYAHYGRAPGSSIIKKDVFFSLGGFSGERMVSDMEFWLRIGRRNSLVKFSHDLYWNRKHAGQEFQTSYARKVYPVRRKQIIEDALSHPECPLSAEELKSIRQLLLRKRRKQQLIKIARKIWN